MQVQKDHSFSVLSEHVRIVIKEFHRHKVNITSSHHFQRSTGLDVLKLVRRRLVHQHVVAKIVFNTRTLCSFDIGVSWLSPEKDICSTNNSVVSDMFKHQGIVHWRRFPIFFRRDLSYAFLLNCKWKTSLSIQPRNTDERHKVLYWLESNVVFLTFVPYLLTVNYSKARFVSVWWILHVTEAVVDVLLELWKPKKFI